MNIAVRAQSTDKTHKRIEDQIFANRRIKIREIADELTLTKSIVGRMVQNDLKFRKACAKLMPKQSSLEHKTKRFTYSLNNLLRYVSEENFLKNIITCDETWVHYNTPETKSQNMVWKQTDSSVTRKFR